MRNSPAWFLLATACGGLPEPPSAEGAFEWSIEPEPQGASASPVLALHVRLSSPEALDLSLYEGELSTYYVNRIRQGDRPATLEDRRIESVTWCDGLECVLRPTGLLSPGIHSLAESGVGVVGSFTVGSEAPLNYMRRVWPPSDSPSSSLEAVYCSASSAPAPGRSEEPVQLEPARIMGHFEPGADSSGALAERCVRLIVTASQRGAVIVPPPVVGVHVFDPSPITFGDVPAAEAVECVSPETVFGPGCATVLDDRLIVRGPSHPMLWVLRRGGGAHEELHAVATGRRFLLRDFTPEADFDIELTARDASGVTWTASVRGRTAPRREHVVINEVLANPFGGEPQQEWVELVNDGSGTVDLAGWTIEDSGRATTLPAAVLGPGELALVVSEAYVPDAEVDLVPSPTTKVLRVDALGKNGLSNTGELVRLRTPASAIASRFSALAPSSPGISQARREPWALDDEPTSIAPHAPPGASPGAPNTVEGETEESRIDFDVYGG